MIFREQNSSNTKQHSTDTLKMKCSKIKQVSQTYQTSTAKQLGKLGIKIYAEDLMEPQQPAFPWPNKLSKNSESNVLLVQLYNYLYS